VPRLSSVPAVLLAEPVPAVLLPEVVRPLPSLETGLVTVQATEPAAVEVLVHL
jgi:hypothetical protein